MRTRIVCETELALLYGLRFPQRVPLIPTIEVGKGTFDRAFAERYWQERVGLEPPPESEA
ncbi:MAG: hypothetical protein HY763_10520 [Planctomycetes bacterium]|nr:hypothetical protein [Planctomycetota bacterium]